MKMLVCTDGSEQSRKALEKAAIMAGADYIEEVAVVHVYEGKVDLYSASLGGRNYVVTDEEIKQLEYLYQEEKEKRQQILEEAVKYLAEQNIAAKAYLKEGHPAHNIVNLAYEEGYDLVVIGSRGYGGLRKLLLGSVSNAVVQEAKNCCVVVVK